MDMSAGLSLIVIKFLCATLYIAPHPTASELPSQLLNAWRADQADANAYAPGSRMALPQEVSVLAACQEAMIDQIGPNSQYYMIAFGSPYFSNAGDELSSIDIFRSRYLYFSLEGDNADFDEFLRLIPRYRCLNQSQGITLEAVGESSSERNN